MAMITAMLFTPATLFHMATVLDVQRALNTSDSTHRDTDLTMIHGPVSLGRNPETSLEALAP